MLGHLKSIKKLNNPKTTISTLSHSILFKKQSIYWQRQALFLTSITWFWKQSFLIKLHMIISQLESSFFCMSVLVSVDAAIKHGNSIVHDEQLMWWRCLKEPGKNKAFESVQGILLKGCFSVGLHPEKHCDPWGLCHEKQENYKSQLLILFLLKRAHSRK